MFAYSCLALTLMAGFLSYAQIQFNYFINSEMTDMNFTYDLANGNARDARGIYIEIINPIV